MYECGLLGALIAREVEFESDRDSNSGSQIQDPNALTSVQTLVARANASSSVKKAVRPVFDWRSRIARCVLKFRR